MFEFKLPDVGEGISEAELLEWRVDVGQHVDEDDVIAFVGTDKVNVELPAPRTGTIGELRWAVGDIVPVGETLVTIDDGDATSGAAAEPATPAAEDAASLDEPRDEPRPVAAEGRSEPSGRPIVAAPSTRRYAAELGVDLDTVQGSGPAGRILRRDVENAGSPDRSWTGSEPTSLMTFEPLRGVRAVAARHMAASSQQTASATSSFEVDADGLLSTLEQVREATANKDIKITPLALVAKCVAAALTDHPRFNATISEDGDGLRLHERVDLGIAVASPDGLVVPVVDDVARRSLLEVATAITDVSRRGREGALELQEIRGGSFTLSSTGGIERARIVSTTPVINLPHVATLWVSRILEKPRVREGRVGAGPIMTASLSFDHRFIDGAEATSFINQMSELLEQPLGALI